MVSDDVAVEVLRLVSTELAVPESRLTPEQRFAEDLGLDSLAAVRLLAAVEERFGVELISTDYLTIERVGDLITHLRRQLGEDGRLA